jgi:hypothetical protein
MQKRPISGHTEVQMGLSVALVVASILAVGIASRPVEYLIIGMQLITNLVWIWEYEICHRCQQMITSKPECPITNTLDQTPKSVEDVPQLMELV